MSKRSIVIVKDNAERELITLEHGKNEREVICLCGEILILRDKYKDVKPFVVCPTCKKSYLTESDINQKDIVDSLIEKIEKEKKELEIIKDFKKMGFNKHCSKDIQDAIDEKIEEIEDIYDDLYEIQKAGYRADYIENIFNQRTSLRL
jgi:hypothetical protein